MASTTTKSKKPSNAAKESKARAAGRTARPTDTPDRIVSRSILLFNRHGLRDVSTDRIAADLGISAGNLAYHFPRKKDLIAATLVVMKARLRAALARPQDVRSPKDGAEFLIRLYHELWSFRFFFNALTHILTDQGMQREYAELREWALDAMISDCVVMAEQGLFIAPVEPNSYRLICINMWSHLLNWLRMQHVRTPLASTPDNDATFDCALLQWSLFQPIMQADFSAELLKMFREMLPPGRKTPLIGAKARSVDSSWNR